MDILIAQREGDVVILHRTQLYARKFKALRSTAIPQHASIAAVLSENGEPLSKATEESYNLPDGCETITVMVEGLDRAVVLSVV